MDWPIVALVAAGEMVTDAGCPGQTPNGVPSNFRPGENFLFAAAAGVECSTKLPITSGDRVSDWALPPLSPVDPPYEN